MMCDRSFSSIKGCQQTGGMREGCGTTLKKVHPSLANSQPSAPTAKLPSQLSWEHGL